MMAWSHLCNPLILKLSGVSLTPVIAQGGLRAALSYIKAALTSQEPLHWVGDHCNTECSYPAHPHIAPTLGRQGEAYSCQSQPCPSRRFSRVQGILSFPFRAALSPTCTVRVRQTVLSISQERGLKSLALYQVKSNI